MRSSLRSHVSNLLPFLFLAPHSVSAQHFTLTADMVVRIRALESAPGSPTMQTGRIASVRGDTVWLRNLSAGMIRDGMLRDGAVAEVEWTHGHALLGALLGGVGGFLAGRIIYGKRDDDIDPGSLFGVLGIPVGAIVGALIRTATWVVLKSDRYVVEVGR